MRASPCNTLSRANSFALAALRRQMARPRPAGRQQVEAPAPCAFQQAANFGGSADIGASGGVTIDEGEALARTCAFAPLRSRFAVQQSSAG